MAGNSKNYGTHFSLLSAPTLLFELLSDQVLLIGVIDERQADARRQRKKITKICQNSKLKNNASYIDNVTVARNNNRHAQFCHQ